MLTGAEFAAVVFGSAVIGAVVVITVQDMLDDRREISQPSDDNDECGGGHVWGEYTDGDRLELNGVDTYVVFPEEYEPEDHGLLKEYKGQAVVKAGTPESNYVGRELGITRHEAEEFDRVKLLQVRRRQRRRCQASNCSSTDERWRVVGRIERDELLDSLYDI